MCGHLDKFDKTKKKRQLIFWTPKQLEQVGRQFGENLYHFFTKEQNEEFFNELELKSQLQTQQDEDPSFMR